MTVQYYTFKDSRQIEAPYGVFSKKEMLSLLEARTAKGRPLGRNAIRYWLYVLCCSSGRKSQPYRLNRKELSQIGLSKSSAYEAISDLLHCGFLESVGITNLEDGPAPNVRRVAHDYSLKIPKKSEISESIEPKKSEISDEKSLKSRTIVHKVLLTKNPSSIIPLTPDQGTERKGTIEYAIVQVIEKTPWLIAGSQYDSKESMKESLLSTPTDTIVKRLVMNADHSLLRIHGYHGSQRKRAVKIELEGVLEQLRCNVILLPPSDPQPNKPTPIPPLNLPKWFTGRHFTDLGCDDFWFEKVGEWREELKVNMKSQFSIWIEPLDFTVIGRPCRFAGDEETPRTVGAFPSLKKYLLLTCPNRHFLEWVKKEYSTILNETIGGTLETDPEERIGLLFVLSGWSGDNPNGPGG